MKIELQEVNKKEKKDKDLYIGVYWMKHNNDIYPTKFNALMKEDYEPGEYEIDFNLSTYKNKYNQLCLGELVLFKK
ncbi:hypothetical protein HXW73_16805 [Halomonas sp. SH5A2]|uniref:hypothetical protein n=1 Tax=Halomonas sp. SH5A2 TaxID=2749040 RepID=UPI00163F9E22|nr:hypothetical protein [Halomonas sp. SH5A2]QNI04465.1 hypothetical protein HXW73_16805 [Halomonas sp. SH5A2]